MYKVMANHENNSEEKRIIRKLYYNNTNMYIYIAISINIETSAYSWLVLSVGNVITQNFLVCTTYEKITCSEALKYTTVFNRMYLTTQKWFPQCSTSTTVFTRGS